MKKVIVSTIVFLMTTSAWAGGSISKADATAAVCAESKGLCQTVQALNLAEEGNAVRVGRQYPNAGERILPFTFSANNGESVVTIDRADNGQLVIVVQ